ncbi:glycosyltransferase family 2 protein [Bacteroidales bacterium OttesenSCG-928-M11]|nr:glycosyltransferase family 2 protein [Bacteroidales bacterium OttesenSCG-928-M11]
MKDQALVSIIVPVYNLEKYISSCIESLINQTYKNLEIIIVDDGSKDASWSIISAYKEQDSRLKIFQQENGGAAKARNRALENVTGKYLLFVDGDDTISLDTIQKNMAIIEKMDLDCVAYPVYRVNEQGEIFEKKGIFQFRDREPRLIKKNDLMRAYYQYQLSGLVCASIFRWERIKKLRFPEGECYEDSFYFIDLLLTLDNYYISNEGKYFYLYRENSAQLSLDYHHLISDIHFHKKCAEEIFPFFPELEQYFIKGEIGLYYHLKKAKAKRIPGASKAFNQYRKQRKYKHKIVYKRELTCFSNWIFGDVFFTKLKKYFNLDQ